MEKTAVIDSGDQPLLPLIFGSTLFLSAVLLFSVQPLAGKLLLPLLGGAPAVWNTVMLFFQAMLLGGYAWAHLSVQMLGPRRQAWVHAVLLAIAVLLVPFSIRGGGESPWQINHPALWALVTLAGALGIPVFVLASTAPLLQKWFAQSRHPAARDPYFLYAASNIGSFGALFAYPLAIEPLLRLQEQTTIWALGYWILAALIAVCAAVVFRGSPAPAETARTQPFGERPARLTIFKWVGLAFVPSSLMLGVTTYVTTDVASIPLLWVLPLALYLFTFVIAFSSHSARAAAASARAVPILALAVVFPILVQATEPVAVLVILHLAFFFFAALQCHLKLAKNRPSVENLTEFYLWMSVGGVLGGIFNALVAPVLFNSVLEYPLMILVGTLIGFPARADHKRKRALPPVYGGSVVILAFAVAAALASLASGGSIVLGNVFTGLILLACFFFVRGPVRYTLALATLLSCTALFRQSQSRVIERDRNLFGVLRVANDSEKPLRRLFHGTTIHGVQFTLPERRCEPLSYYHSQGPVADIAALFQKAALPRRVGLVGLGAGAMICYSQSGEQWSLFEIDPAVVRIAQDTNYFTYLSDCSRAQFRVVLGDARLRLQTEENHSFGILYLDAFSSDVIPMHLLTREAVELYRRKLAPDGILAFHLSSRHFELEPLVAKLGEAAGLQCYASIHGDLNAKALAEGGLESTWAILVPERTVPLVLASGSFRRILPSSDAPLWTDNFSSLVGVLKLN